MVLCTSLYVMCLEGGLFDFLGLLLKGFFLFFFVFFFYFSITKREGSNFAKKEKKRRRKKKKRILKMQVGKERQVKTDTFGILSIPIFNWGDQQQQEDHFEPFSQQISGHSPFLSFSDNLLLKPYLSERELWFYNYTHTRSRKEGMRRDVGFDCLQFQGYLKWVPSFKGCSIVEEEELPESSSPPTSSSPSNPWSVRIHENREEIQVKELIQTDDHQHLYLVLENLSINFFHPSILDLKLGTITVGKNNPNQSMRKRHAWKCQETTSASLGFRICGMQVFLPSDEEGGVYGYFGKYEGRDVKDGEMLKELGRYFHNGKRLRRDIVKDFVAEMQELVDFMENNHSFAFYSSSLLLHYEGGKRESRGVSLKLIDFSEVYPINGGHGVEVRDGESNDGVVLGLRNILQYFKSLANDVSIGEKIQPLDPTRAPEVDKPLKWRKS